MTANAPFIPQPTPTDRLYLMLGGNQPMRPFIAVRSTAAASHGSFRMPLVAAMFLTVAIVAAACAGCSSTPGDGKPAGGAATLEILDLDGIKQRIASHKDKKVVVVDFWSTSCEPCMKEFPGLVALADKHPDAVACVSVSLDFEGGKNRQPEDARDKVLKFLESQKAAKVTNILCGTPSDDVLSDAALNLGGSPPVVVVYRRDGSVAKTFENGSAESEEDYFSYADVNKLVDELLAAD